MRWLAWGLGLCRSPGVLHALIGSFAASEIMGVLNFLDKISVYAGSWHKASRYDAVWETGKGSGGPIGTPIKANSE